MADDVTPDGSDTALTVGVRVRVLHGPHADTLGVIVDDFGDSVGGGGRSGRGRIVEPARRWAVALDDGGLVFLDSTDLTPVAGPSPN